MTHKNIFRMISYIILHVLIISACTTENDYNWEKVDTTKHTIRMKLIGDIERFDKNITTTNPSTRANNTSWKNGDKIYLTFYKESDIIPRIPAVATYDSSSGWYITLAPYFGDIAPNTQGKCEAYYFTNTNATDRAIIPLNSYSEIYEDLNAEYSNMNGELIVKTTMTPKTGRIRFTGTAGDIVHITGMSIYTSFDHNTNEFSSTNAPTTLTVTKDGTTPYIYGYFPDQDKYIGIVGTNFAFTRQCTDKILAKGESGYMAIPSNSSHKNWMDGLCVKASNVKFKMMPVTGFYDSDTNTPNSFFLIAETETTEALYNSVTGELSTSLLPVDNISFFEIQSFIEKLNEETNLHFSLPTSLQWIYAAKGGDKSLGYTYAGSNTPDEVAWYYDNCISKQEVKKKFPNEIGLYDMSGNVGEFFANDDSGVGELDFIYDYNGNDYIIGFWGGGYSSKPSFIGTNSVALTYGQCKTFGYKKSEKKDDAFYGVGFRLVLTL